MEDQKDHDLLIEINTILKQVVRDIQDLKDGTSTKISNHERRIESIEKDLATHKMGNKITLGIYATIGGALAYMLINHIVK